MYTTACESCRKARIKCIRPSRGHDPSQVCERCRATESACTTVRRRVGRQPGVKNKKNKKRGVLSSVDAHVASTGDGDHLPIPMHALASSAEDRQSHPESKAVYHQLSQWLPPNADDILDHHAAWVSKIHSSTARQAIAARLDALFAFPVAETTTEAEEPLAFGGRIDMARPDASPEHDVISLQIISLEEAQHLFEQFMLLVTNGSMHFDPRLHSLEFVRRSSSFLLAVILAVASTYTRICSSARLHSQLMAHAERLEALVHKNNLKSVEIIQALCLLSAWSEVPSVLSQDKAWLYISRAIALSVELRLDTALPYCVESDPLYETKHDILIRNAHRTWLLLFIHDRNMSMVAGRYSLMPESSITSQSNLEHWGRHPRALDRDAALCGSVLLRKLVFRLSLETANWNGFPKQRADIDRSLAEWRITWASEIQSTHEYDIIARFATFVLVLTILRRKLHFGHDDAECRAACETYAFEVVCSAINHYKSWPGLLNSATFDTSMVAFCAIYTVQSIKSPSEWSLFRLATLQELVAELSRQADERHSGYSEDKLTVVDAMSRQLSRAIKHVLSRIQSSMMAAPQLWDSLGPSQSTGDQPLLASGFELDHLITATLPDWGLQEISPNLPTLAVPMFDFNQIASFFGDGTG